MTKTEMVEALANVAYEVDEFTKYRQLTPDDCAASLRHLIKVVAELVAREGNEDNPNA